MENKNEGRLSWITSGYIFLLIFLIILVSWSIYLAREIKTYKEQRKDLKREIEKIEILEKVNRNFIKDILRQKAVALCFLELIEKFETKYSPKQKENCIQLIVMMDEKHGSSGLDAPLILAWVEKESLGDPEAISPAGAKGLTQWSDYRAWTLLKEMGYPGYDKKLIFDPVINLSGGLSYLIDLLRFWEWKGVKDQKLLLDYVLLSYRFGVENIEEVFNVSQNINRAAEDYTNAILNRRVFWAERLKYWIDDAQLLLKSLE